MIKFIILRLWTLFRMSNEEKIMGEDTENEADGQGNLRKRNFAESAQKTFEQGIFLVPIVWASLKLFISSFQVITKKNTVFWTFFGTKTIVAEESIYT